MNHKNFEKDYGQELFNVVIFLLALLAVLWFMKV